MFFFFFKQKTAYEMRISDWSSDVCSSDLSIVGHEDALHLHLGALERIPTGLDRKPIHVAHPEWIALHEPAEVGAMHVVVGKPEVRRCGLRHPREDMLHPDRDVRFQTDRKSTRLNSSH